MNKLKDFMIRKRYSSRTVEVYTSLVGSFLTVLKNRNPNNLTDEEIGRYITRFYVQTAHSGSYQNQAVNALKLFYRAEYNRDIGQLVSLRPKREQKLPIVLSQQEVQALLTSFTNSKHRTLFYLIYSGGLRFSEVTSLKMTDIDSKQGIIRIRESKGAKDRELPLSQTALEQLRIYDKEYKPPEYLFEG